jgi:uncharacterized membrane protein
LLYVKLTTSPMWLVHRHTFINALPKNSCFLLFTFVFTVTLSPSYSLIQIDITVTASDGDCYMSNFRPRQCGLFIVILSSTLSLKTVVFFYPLLFLQLLSPRLKYSRLALCMDALPYAPYFRQRFAPFFRHRRRSQGYLKSRHRLLA